ncbi:MAG: hypothetical protein KJ971_01345 [Firmicutes bacterium]|nr:hypothetical protein [Bacillota bacterium]
MTKKRFKLESSKIVYLILVGIVFLELIASIISVVLADDADIRDAGISNIFLAILAIALFSIPWIIESRFKLDIPNYLEILVLIFLFCAIVLGNIHGFLVSINGYDKVLHIVSGITISIIAFEIIHFYNQSRELSQQMNTRLVSIFAFTFAITLLVFWEFYEFIVDTIAYNSNEDTLRNMQRYQWENLIPIFPQDNGLVDTMLDLIVGSIGAFVVSIVGWKLLDYKQFKKNKKR